jgi:hypothetical protein
VLMASGMNVLKDLFDNEFVGLSGPIQQLALITEAHTPHESPHLGGLIFA